MRNRSGIIIIACILVVISLAIYIIHQLLFNNLKDTLYYTIMDLAFLPLQVLLVGIIIERLLARREAAEKISKLNMVVGTFFSEIGNNLSKLLLAAASDREGIISKLNVSSSWKAEDFKRAQNFAAKDASADFSTINLAQLRELLVSRRQFMITLIENPNLLEHERFTDLLLSSFHLMEELESRPSLIDLPGKDLAHLNGDIRRAYQYLVIEWLDYMQHIKTNYPFLYSHFLRTHPFQPNPSAIIE